MKRHEDKFEEVYELLLKLAEFKISTYIYVRIISHPSGVFAQSDVFLFPLFAEALVALLVQNALPSRNRSAGADFLRVRRLRATARSHFVALLRREEVRSPTIFPRRRRRRTRRRTFLVVLLVLFRRGEGLGITGRNGKLGVGG